MKTKNITPQQIEVINEDINTANEIIIQLKEIWNEKAQLSTLAELRHWQKERRTLVETLATIQPNENDEETTSSNPQLSDWFPTTGTENHTQNNDDISNKSDYMLDKTMQNICQTKPPPAFYRNIYMHNKSEPEIEKINDNTKHQQNINDNTIKAPP